MNELHDTFFIYFCQYLGGNKRSSVCLTRQGSEGGGTPAIAKHTEDP